MKNKTLIKIVIGLLVLIAILIIIDILTGIWYWNRLNLKFSYSVFYNILTPLSSSISIIIYTIALFVTIRQNKVINSHNLKDSFLKEISRFKSDASNIKVELKELYYTDFLDFRTKIMDIFLQLWNNREYLIDSQNKEKKITKIELESKSYYPQIIFLQQFSLLHSIHHGYYQGLKRFISEILLSDLIENHKKMIINEIEKDLLKDYLNLISDIIATSNINGNESPFLILTLTLPDLNYKWKDLGKTEFTEFYDWYIKEIKNAYA